MASFESIVAQQFSLVINFRGVVCKLGNSDVTHNGQDAFSFCIQDSTGHYVKIVVRTVNGQSQTIRM